MVYLNYNNLDGETQERLLKRSLEEIENKHGKELGMYAVNYQKDLVLSWKKKQSVICIITNSFLQFKSKLI